MKRMIRLLEGVKDYNTFREVAEFEHVNGTQQDLYFRIVQKEADSDPSSTLARRWLPSSSATVTFKFDNLDSDMVITRVGTMVYPNDDRSIFKVTLLSGDVINGSVSMTLTDGGLSETLLLDGRLIASGTDSDRFFC